MAKDSIQNFLSAVDRVLNSNTLLLRFAIQTKSSLLKEALKDILEKDIFKEEFLKQDIERGWLNYHLIDVNNPQQFIAHPGGVYNDCSAVELIPISQVECKALLIEMLTTNGHSHFFSPYRYAKERDEAQSLVSLFLEELSHSREWQAYRMTPDFLYSTIEAADREGIMGYFEVECASDSATLFHFNDEIALLLTNGKP